MIFEITFVIGLALLAGVLIGTISTIIIIHKESTTIKKELDFKSKQLQKLENNKYENNKN
tara:strand:+ start:876 stop:1055 length:180 start_codon:yes stop_codon:yes gene_type:complete